MLQICFCNGCGTGASMFCWFLSQRWRLRTSCTPTCTATVEDNLRKTRRNIPKHLCEDTRRTRLPWRGHHTTLRRQALGTAEDTARSRRHLRHHPSSSSNKWSLLEPTRRRSSTSTLSRRTVAPWSILALSPGAATWSLVWSVMSWPVSNLIHW